MSTSNDAHRYADVKLGLNCPNCGSAGLVPLEQLDCMLFCFGCQKRDRVERKGLVELPDDRVGVQVRTHLSAWQGHEAIIVSRPAIFGSWLIDRLIGFVTRGFARWIALAGTLLLASVLIALGTRPPPEPLALVIPDTLDGRVELFSQALAKRDMALMVRLTDPAQHRSLRIWVGKGTGIPAKTADEEAEARAKIVGTSLNPTGDRADMRVAITTASGEMVVDQQWAQRTGVWYFQPVKFRLPAIRQGAAKSYSKQKRGG